MSVMAVVVVVVVVLVGLGVLGALVSGGERKRAPARLAEAQAALERDEPNEALRLLGEALWVPLSDRYPAQDAAVALEVVRLTARILRDMGTDPAPLTGKLEAALERASARGGEVAAELTGPVKSFLEEFAAGDEPAVDALVAKVLSGELEVEERDGGPVGELSPAEQKVVNEVGRMLLAGKSPQAVIAAIERHLPQAEGTFRAALLGQRGGCRSMQDDLAGAAEDYAECVKLEPGDPIHAENLAEVRGKLKKLKKGR